MYRQNIDYDPLVKTETKVASVVAGSGSAVSSGPTGEPSDPLSVVVEGGDLSAAAGGIVQRCLIDVDGTDLTEFVAAYQHTVEDGVLVSTFLGNFTDESLSTPYTVLGVETEPGEVGDAAITRLDHIILKDGDTWSPGSLVCSFDAVAIIGQPEVISSTAPLSQLTEGQSVSWSRTDGAALDPSFTITARAGTTDCVSIAVNSLGA